MQCLSPAENPPPRAGGRGDGARAAGGGMREARYATQTGKERLQHPPARPAHIIDAGAPASPVRMPAVAATDQRRRGDARSRASSAGFGHPEAIARRNRATGVQAAGSTLWPPNRADFGHPEVIARRACATGAQAARRHRGEVGARRRSWMTAPSAGRARADQGCWRPSARQRSRRRTTGGGRRNGPRPGA
jgi:hypothetical protein